MAPTPGCTHSQSSRIPPACLRRLMPSMSVVSGGVVALIPAIRFAALRWNTDRTLPQVPSFCSGFYIRRSLSWRLDQKDAPTFWNDLHVPLCRHRLREVLNVRSQEYTVIWNLRDIFALQDQWSVAIA